MRTILTFKPIYNAWRYVWVGNNPRHRLILFKILPPWELILLPKEASDPSHPLEQYRPLSIFITRKDKKDDRHCHHRELMISLTMYWLKYFLYFLTNPCSMRVCVQALFKVSEKYVSNRISRTLDCIHGNLDRCLTLAEQDHQVLLSCYKAPQRRATYWMWYVVG